MCQKGTKRKKQKENTKQNVYFTARRLFEEKGFNNVTIEEIAEKAGVSVGTIYFHFNSKQEIMAEYHSELDQAYSEYLKRQEDSLDYARKSSLEKIHDFVLFCIEISAKLGVENIRVVYPYMMCNEAFGSSILNWCINGGVDDISQMSERLVLTYLDGLCISRSGEHAHLKNDSGEEDSALDR